MTQTEIAHAPKVPDDLQYMAAEKGQNNEERQIVKKRRKSWIKNVTDPKKKPDFLILGMQPVKHKK